MAPGATLPPAWRARLLLELPAGAAWGVGARAQELLAQQSLLLEDSSSTPLFPLQQVSRVS